jgi:hypothetical protein
MFVERIDPARELAATREWVAGELAAGEDAIAEALVAAREADWALWWSTGWVADLAEATADAAGDVWEAW